MTASPALTTQIDSLKNGNLSWSDRTFNDPADACEFVTDAQHGRRDIDLQGQRSGEYNFQYDWPNMALYPGLTGACDPAQNKVPDEIVIESDQSQTLGQPSNKGSITITVGADTFTSDFHEMELTRVNHPTRYISGQFKAVATNHASRTDTRVLVITNGSFSGNH